MAIWAGCAVSKFAEWVASDVVSKLVSSGYSYLRERILPYNSEAELKRLKTALPQITAVMGVAEALKMKDPHTSEWVEQFRQAVEASQLVLNEFEYKNNDEAGESASSSKKRKRCTISDGTLKRLKDAVTLLDRATTDIDRLLRLATTLGVQGVSESRQYTNKILRQEINLCLAEREVLGYRNLCVNSRHLKLSYLEIDQLHISSLPKLPSLKCLRILTIENCASLTSLSFLEIESCKWLNPLPEIENLKAIRLMQNSFTLSMAASIARLMNRHNISISTADLLKELPELLTSLEEKDITGHGMQNQPSQISVEPALNRSGLEALQAFLGLTCSPCNVGFIKGTSSELAELKNTPERHEVGESSHPNEVITTDVD